MSVVAEGAMIRLAYVAEVTPGQIPANPSWKTLRYQTSDLKSDKQTDTPEEVSSDGNLSAAVDVGQTINGGINGLYSYGTYDDLVAGLFRSNWNSNVLVNGKVHKTFAFEEMFDADPDIYIRHVGVRVNTLEMTLEAKRPVSMNFGLMGLESPLPENAALTGATYAAETTTEVFNAALNVADITWTGITNPPIVNRLNLRISSGLYANEAIAMRGTHSHGMGMLRVEGSVIALFDKKDTVEAIRNHDTLGLAFTLEDKAGNSYLHEIPSFKLLNGGPSKPGNGQSARVDAPLQAHKNAGIGGTMRITRTPG